MNFIICGEIYVAKTTERGETSQTVYPNIGITRVFDLFYRPVGSLLPVGSAIFVAIRPDYKADQSFYSLRERPKHRVGIQAVWRHGRLTR